ncbi:helix-turn-helix domain-containing protein [Sulfurimonas diazotrophicus]|uniref:Helix-turn-helix domain-containing protein n=1 Tax=Sulfurimonas diazotrophicus TaxID=3131939 RepID=A0ABZ3H9X4_9BACT
MEIELEHLKMLPRILEIIELMKKEMDKGAAKRWLNVKELAEYLGYSRDRIYKIKDEYFIEGVHFHNRTGKILFDRVAIDSWVVGKDTDEAHQSQRQIVDNVLSSIKEV